LPVIAKGADAVRKLRQALRGELPKGAIEELLAHLDRSAAERFERRKAKHAEMSRLLKRTRESLITQILRDNPEVKQDLQGLRDWATSRNKVRIKKPLLRPRLEPHVTAGSFEWFENPPYDQQWFWPALADQGSDSSGNVLLASADSEAGTYNVELTSEGAGPKSSAAGVGVLFSAPAQDTMQNFAAILNYNLVWGDNAAFVTADVDLQTSLGVWGFTENAWVAQTNIGPSVQNHVNWLSWAGTDAAGDNGLVGQLVTFPAAANSQYMAWVWSNGYVEADSAVGFSALAMLQLSVNVEYVSFSTPG
jgi:hypothetical protein